MDDLRTIGQVARLSGLSVPTVRFYSDAGLVPVAARTAGGHRLYDREALHRLELIRTLRELGVDLATVARLLTREHTVAEVADREAAALERQIQDLRVRRSVLRYAAARDADADGLVRAGRLARLSGEQRRALVAGLVAESTAGLELEPGFAARLRSLLPEPPDDPERIEAWVELAHLVSDPDFRSSVRRALERHAADRATGADGGDPGRLAPGRGGGSGAGRRSAHRRAVPRLGGGAPHRRPARRGVRRGAPPPRRPGVPHVARRAGPRRRRCPGDALSAAAGADQRRPGPYGPGAGGAMVPRRAGVRRFRVTRVFASTP